MKFQAESGALNLDQKVNLESPAIRYRDESLLSFLQEGVKGVDSLENFYREHKPIGIGHVALHLRDFGKCVGDVIETFFVVM